MTRRLRPEETHIWAKVAATVRPSPGRRAPMAMPVEVRQETLPAISLQPTPTIGPKPKKHAPPEDIEPGRKRRISREQELGPRIDLHGLDQDRARQALTGFITRASEDGWRAVLVITGKGALGDGVLRRMAPHWLAEPPLRALVAGVSEAQRHHGGAGALYVALKRRKG